MVPLPSVSQSSASLSTVYTCIKELLSQLKLDYICSLSSKREPNALCNGPGHMTKLYEYIRFLCFMSILDFCVFMSILDFCVLEKILSFIPFMGMGAGGQLGYSSEGLSLPTKFGSSQTIHTYIV